MELYDWEIENYELQARECWTIEAIPKKQTQQFFSISVIPKIFEHTIREYRSLPPLRKGTSNQTSLRYK